MGKLTYYYLDHQRQTNVFFVNEGGMLRNRSSASGADLPLNSRSTAYLDWDGDGDLDIAINNFQDAATMLRNNSQARGNHWIKVRLIGDPSRKTNRDAARQWRDAGEYMGELVGRELWAHELPESIGDGFDFSREVVVEHFAEGIADDFRSTLERNRSLRRGDFGRGFIATWNWTTATAELITRTVWLPIGAAGGIAYAATAPVVQILWRPTRSVVQATGGGIVWPFAVHGWNGTTGLMRSGSVP